jgi:hypothetical protein
MTGVISKYFYIINFKYFLKPRIYPVYFTSKQAAKRAIRENIKSKKDRALYEIVKGSKLKDFDCTYVFKLGKLGEFKKWEYTPELDTKQKRKSYRTLLRRRLRRMGMLTPVKPKYNVDKPLEQVRLIKNKQWIADSPNTMAMCFRLERKNKNWHYIIIKKKISKKKGILFEIKALRVDIRTKQLKFCKISIQRKDLIIPYLLTETIQLYGKEQDILDACRGKGISLDYRTQKSVLTKMRQRA